MTKKLPTICKKKSKWGMVKNILLYKITRSNKHFFTIKVTKNYVSVSLNELVNIQELEKLYLWILRTFTT